MKCLINQGTSFAKIALLACAGLGFALFTPANAQEKERKKFCQAFHSSAAQASCFSQTGMSGDVQNLRKFCTEARDATYEAQIRIAEAKLQAQSLINKVGAKSASTSTMHAGAQCGAHSVNRDTLLETQKISIKLKASKDYLNKVQEQIGKNRTALSKRRDNAKQNTAQLMRGAQGQQIIFCLENNTNILLKDFQTLSEQRYKPVLAELQKEIQTNDERMEELQRHNNAIVRALGQGATSICKNISSEDVKVARASAADDARASKISEARAQNDREISRALARAPAPPPKPAKGSMAEATGDILSAMQSPDDMGVSSVPDKKDGWWSAAKEHAVNTKGFVEDILNGGQSRTDLRDRFSNFGNSAFEAGKEGVRLVQDKEFQQAVLDQKPLENLNKIRLDAASGLADAAVELKESDNKTKFVADKMLEGIAAPTKLMDSGFTAMADTPLEGKEAFEAAAKGVGGVGLSALQLQGAGQAIGTTTKVATAGMEKMGIKNMLTPDAPSTPGAATIGDDLIDANTVKTTTKSTPDAGSTNTPAIAGQNTPAPKSISQSVDDIIDKLPPEKRTQYIMSRTIGGVPDEDVWRTLKSDYPHLTEGVPAPAGLKKFGAQDSTPPSYSTVNKTAQFKNEAPSVRNFSQEELANAKVVVEPDTGRLVWDKNKSPVKIPEQEPHIYVMDPDGSLYVAKPKLYDTHHSSFFGKTGNSQGKNAVAAAGEVRMTKDGVLVFDDKSGHFMPKQEQLNNLYNELSRQGLSPGKPGSGVAVQDRITKGYNPQRTELGAGPQRISDEDALVRSPQTRAASPQGLSTQAQQIAENPALRDIPEVRPQRAIASEYAADVKQNSTIADMDIRASRAAAEIGLDRADNVAYKKFEASLDKAHSQVDCPVGRCTDAELAAKSRILQQEGGLSKDQAHELIRKGYAGSADAPLTPKLVNVQVIEGAGNRPPTAAFEYINAKILKPIAVENKGPVQVFRGGAERDIRPGDWVSPNRDLAENIYAQGGHNGGQAGTLMTAKIDPAHLYEIHPGGWVYLPPGTSKEQIGKILRYKNSNGDPVFLDDILQAQRAQPGLRR